MDDQDIAKIVIVKLATRINEIKKDIKFNQEHISEDSNYWVSKLKTEKETYEKCAKLIIEDFELGSDFFEQTLTCENTKAY